MIDANGREHEPAGSSAGGQFAAGGVVVRFSKEEKHALSEYAKNADQINEQLTSKGELLPMETAADAHAAAYVNQQFLIDTIKPLVAEAGGELSNPGVKKLETIAEKMVRKNKLAREVNDAVRAGFTVTTPEHAESIANKIKSKFDALDEGWSKTDAGYFDRTLIVKFPNGQKGEIQIWHPELIKLKHNGGSDMYDRYRSEPKKSLKYKYWHNRSVRHYAPVYAAMDSAWEKTAREMPFRG